MSVNHPTVGTVEVNAAGDMVASQSAGTDIVAVTKSDATADPNGPFRALIMDAEGAVKITTQSGDDRVLPTGLLAAQTIYQIQFTRVWSTGTGAQAIYGIV